MTPSKLLWRALLVSLALPGCGRSCSRSTQATVKEAAPLGDDTPLTDAEATEMRATLPHERCEDIGRRYNILAGRSESERHPKTLELISACQRAGNLAWYKCTAQATTADQFDRCSSRLLRSP